jgi:hypothetical protein
MKLADPDFDMMDATMTEDGHIRIRLQRRPFLQRFMNHYRWCRLPMWKTPRWRAICQAWKMARIGSDDND